MKRVMLGVLLVGLLSACDNGKAELQGRVDALTRENMALKAERDAMKAQLDTVRTVSVTRARQQVLTQFLQRCQLAVETYRTESPTGGLDALQPLEGKSCTEEPLNMQAFPDVKNSVITVTPGAANEYRIQATTVDGQSDFLPK